MSETLIEQRVEGYRLSPQQERLWRLARRDPAAYAARLEVDLSGSLDAGRLRRALEWVVERHDGLRMRYEQLPGMGVPVQVVAPASLAWRELAAAPEGSATSPLDAAGEGRPAEPGSAQPSATLIRRGPGEATLALALPALAADEQSLRLVLEELCEAYASLVAGRQPERDPAVGYVQFAEWQNQLFDDLEAPEREVWQRLELAARRPLRLPFERPARGPSAFLPRSVPVPLPAETGRRIEAAAAELGATLEAFLLAAWSTLLARLGGEASPLVAYVASGRDHELLAGAVGLLARSLPLAVTIDDEAPFAQLVAEVGRAVAEGRDHAGFHLWGESREVAREADAFPVAAFRLDPWPPAASGAGVTFTPRRLLCRRERFKLELAVRQEGGELSADLSYDAARIDAADARRVAAQLAAALAALAARPETAPVDVDLLTEEERGQLHAELYPTAVEPAGTPFVHRRFEAMAERFPDRPAVVDERGQLTYAELDVRANRLAQRLRRLGVGPDVPVALCLDRSKEVVTGLLGILKAGGAYVPLEPAQPKSRLALMLDEVAPPVLVTERALASGFTSFRGSVIELDGEPLETESAESPRVPLFPEQLAYVIFTSGSTGRPKGVAVEHRQLASYVDGVVSRLDLPAGGSYATVSTFAADLGNTAVFPALTLGGCLHVVSTERASDPAALADYFARYPMDVLKIVPSHLEALQAVARPERVLPRRRLVVGGEASRREWAERLRSLLPDGCRLFNHYGPSETTVGVLTREVAQPVDERCASVPLGLPIPNVTLRLLDRRRRPVPRWVPGELSIGGGSVSRGYLGRPAQTAERFVPDPSSERPGARLYRTGDLVRQVADGSVEFLGRIDRQVKFHGFRVELEEIRSVLNRHPQVRDSVVLVHRDAQGHDVLVAYYVARQELDVSELRAFLSEIILAETLPNVFVHLRRLPLTLNGKVNHEALPGLDAVRQQQASRKSTPPRTPTEQVLAGLWCEVLGAARVGVEDSFFELGGHSLIATQLVSRVRQVFKVELPLRSLFDAPTVAGLAGRIETALRAGDAVPVPPIGRVPRDRPLPLSFAQERLWFMHQLDPGSAAYNVPGATLLEGRLEVGALDAALGQVVRRHEGLRTRFVDEEGTPYQVVEPSLRLPLPVLDLSSLPEASREAELARLAGVEAASPFDLARLPLLRLRLVRLGGLRHVVLFTLHHVVSDAWSNEVFARELTQQYRALVAGRPAGLAELPVQYADFAAWQRQWLSGEALEGELAYWRRQLAGAPEELALPTDRPRPAEPSFSGAARPFVLSSEERGAVEALSRQERVTPFMTLLAAFQVLLYRYSGQTDLVVGTDVANRNRLAIEDLIGFFVNNLVLRTDLSGEPTFRELLARVREVTLQAYAHQDLPFERLVKELRPRRALARMPLFQVLFVVQNAPRAAAELPDLVATPLDFASERVKFDLALFVRESEGGLRGAWSYSTDLFDTTTIDRMSAHFVRLLASICRQPDARLNQLEMWSDMERKEREESTLSRLRGARQRSAERRPVSPVTAEPLRPGEPLPLVIRPAVRDLDLVGWAASERESLEARLIEHGAILFRGFPLHDVADFERFAQAVCPDLYGEYGDLPREGEGGKIYQSTPYPADKTILFHNESSHLGQWPMKQWFFCVTAAQRGGETPIADGRRIYRALDPEVAARFEAKGLMYVRNFIPGFDVSWQEFFRTEDRAEVEERCRRSGLELVWKGDGLQTRQLSPAVAQHPKTGEKVFFNQIQLHHVSSLDPEVRDSMRSLFAEDDLPRNVRFGDGEPIPDDLVAQLLALYWQAAVSFAWQEGDVLMVDNMLTSHARNPYAGPRKIAVAMGELLSARELAR